MDSSPASVILDGVFKNIASRNEQVRAQATTQLKQLAKDELARAQDSADENRVASNEIDFAARIMTGLSGLVENSDEPHRLGAIAAMDMLVRLDQEMDATTGIRFANHLNFMIRHEWPWRHTASLLTWPPQNAPHTHLPAPPLPFSIYRLEWTGGGGGVQRE